MCGRPLDALQRVPADLLQHLGAQLDILAPDIATIRTIYRRRRATLFEHQGWAISYLGMRRFQSRDQVALMGPLTNIVRAGVSGDHLRSATRRLLYEHRIIIPGHRRLGDSGRNATTKVELEALEFIERAIPANTRTRWAQALSHTVGDTSLTLLEYLQEPPGKFSLSTIERQFDNVDRLRHLGVSKYLVPSITPAQLQAYAQGMRRRRGESSAADAFVTGIRGILSRADVPAEERVEAIQRLLRQLNSGTLRAPCLAPRQREVLVSQSAQIRPLIKMLLALELRCDQTSSWSGILLNWSVAYSRELDYVSERMCPVQSRVNVASRSQQYRFSQLRTFPRCSGSEVVGATTIAPVGLYVKAFSMISDRVTSSRQRP
jgi:hypothetical protein